MRSLGALLLLITAIQLAAQSPEGYAGAAACAKCHAAIHREWSGSRHAKMMQPATKSSVTGDFGVGKAVLRGSTYLLAERDGSYYITESDLARKPWEHRIDYTLGSRRVQQYLTTMPDGSIVVLPATWDALRKKWIHDLDAANPEESPNDVVPIWNKTCYSCHVSRGQKNFDPEGPRYRTAWQSLGVDCESCHGPGSRHAAKPARDNIVNPARLDAARSTMVCAQCHSSRDIYADGFPAGADYYDSFMPVMEYRLPAYQDPAFWPDGRPRWFANDSVALWQSQCFLKGRATCITCHAGSHNPQPRADANAVCAGCHKAVVANLPAHTHHAPKSAGSSCVECHMPPTVTGLNAHMRDHSIGIPVPENTVTHGIPNACNLCHQDKDAAWASQQMTAWYGAKTRQRWIRRAHAFTQARQESAAAIPALLEILSDPSGGPWIRANAAGYLGSFPNDPTAYGALLRAFTDPEPLVRATAASAIRPRAAQREALAPQLVSLLKDPALTVRMNAGIAPGGHGGAAVSRRRRRTFRARQRTLRRARPAGFRRCQPAVRRGQVLLSFGRHGSRRRGLARHVEAGPGASRAVPAGPVPGSKRRFRSGTGDSESDSARRSRVRRGAADCSPKWPRRSHGDTNGGSGAQARFLDGQVKYQSKYYGAALQEFEQALKLAPQAEWAGKAKILRAVCLEKLARTEEAEAAMRSPARRLRGRTGHGSATGLRRVALRNGARGRGAEADRPR